MHKERTCKNYRRTATLRIAASDRKYIIHFARNYVDLISWSRSRSKFAYTQPQPVQTHRPDFHVHLLVTHNNTQSLLCRIFQPLYTQAILRRLRLSNLSEDFAHIPTSTSKFACCLVILTRPSSRFTPRVGLFSSPSPKHLFAHILHLLSPVEEPRVGNPSTLSKWRNCLNLDSLS